MKIYTKTGDTGETSLLGGKRVDKNCLEIEAIGEVDELNAHIGVLISILPDTNRRDEVLPHLYNVQHALFNVGANLAAVQTDLVSVPDVPPSAIAELESWIDKMEKDLQPLTAFILPGGHPAAAQAMLARAVCRRAERRVTDVARQYPNLPKEIPQFLNRLSDALFVLARWTNKQNDVEDVRWEK